MCGLLKQVSLLTVTRLVSATEWTHAMLVYQHYIALIYIHEVQKAAKICRRELMSNLAVLKALDIQKRH